MQQKIITLTGLFQYQELLYFDIFCASHMYSMYQGHIEGVKLVKIW